MVYKSLFILMCLTSFCFADTGFPSTVNVTETDHSPSCQVGQIQFSPGSVTCQGQVAKVSTLQLVAGAGISISCVSGVCTITNTGGGGGSTFILMEDSSDVLAEDGSKLLTE